ncbi:MAG TPA: hypothetical protein DEB40_03485 [Elusimicrobia bacterium]|nr:hypothetical protein [Elusimicrobiota bacterium]HBT60791.1 hypothetical protein [Elusimicrobiota bacterium]
MAGFGLLGFLKVADFSADFSAAGPWASFFGDPALHGLFRIRKPARGFLKVCQLFGYFQVS